MASAPKVGATSATSPTSPISGWGGGSSRASGADKVAGASAGAGAFGVESGWRPTYDDRHGQGYFFFGQYPQKEDPAQPLFTPLMARFASAFAAVEPLTDRRTATPIFVADLMRGVGIYDFNLKVIAGTLAMQGSVINRYG